MKPLKITYWISTAIPVMVFATTGTMYLFHAPVMVAKFHELGYPLYVLNILGIAKVLGVTALVAPKYPRLKEWAYAGFVFDLVGAIWSHAAVQGFGEAARLLVPLTIIVISYVTYHKVYDHPGKGDLAA
ncbi:MAG: DoxX family protein [Acidobacteriaceae bacterium]